MTVGKICQKPAFTNAINIIGNDDFGDRLCHVTEFGGRDSSLMSVKGMLQDRLRSSL